MGLSFTHIILLLVVVLVIFGAGKLPNVMGDLGKGVRNFKSGLNDDTKTDERKLNDPTASDRLDQDAKFADVKLREEERAPPPPPAAPPVT